MAETPDLGAVQETFTNVEKEFQEIETTFNDVKNQWESNQEDPELKTKFEETQTKYNETKSNYDKVYKEYFDTLKSNVRTGYWPEDWREKYVAEQKDKEGKPLDDKAKEKLMSRLSRYASPQAALDAMVNAQNKISAGGMVKIPGKDATPEEIAEYRKSIGVPEDPKGYDLTLGNGLVIGDEDKDMVNGFLEHAHKSNYTQAQVSAGLNWYYQNIEAQQAAQHEADVKFSQEAEDYFRQEWGAEFRANQNLMANFLSTYFPEGVDSLLAGARLADGTPLANHIGIVKGFVAAARKANPEAALVPATGTKAFDAMQDEIEALEKRMGTDPDWHKDKRAHERYMKLVEMRDRNKK
jgi:hypothetical protein